MKLLLAVCAIILVAQFTDARLISINDIIRGYNAELDIENTHVQLATEHLYIPTSLKACTNSACDSICKALGFNHGTCVSSSTCHCYN